MSTVSKSNKDYILGETISGLYSQQIIFGKNRKNSEKYGLKVRLCDECHYRLHNQDEALAMKYRKLGQLYFEARWGHEKYMQVFGRNYL